jgi:hypothetical protein
MVATTKSLNVSKVDDLLSMTQTELDELYRSSPVGEIPKGDTMGTAILMPRSALGKTAKALVRLLVWQGKVFNPVDGDLKNKVSPFGVKSIRAMVYVGDSWMVKGEQAIVIDYSKTSFVAQKIRDEIRQVAPRLYLGKVFWGRKHVLDFSLSLDK